MVALQYLEAHPGNVLNYVNSADVEPVPGIAPGVYDFHTVDALVLYLGFH
jgi:hypothetical protein